MGETGALAQLVVAVFLPFPCPRRPVSPVSPPRRPDDHDFPREEYTMKRHLFPVLLLALILPVLTSCPQNSGHDDTPGNTPDDSVPSGSLRDGDLVLKGTLYTEEREAGEIKHGKYTSLDTVEVYAYGELLGEAALTNGEFSIRVSKPAALGPIEPSSFYNWTNPKIEPADTEYTEISLLLKEAGKSIIKGGIYISGDYPRNYQVGGEYVWYLYVDKDAAVTLEGEEGEDEWEYEGITYTGFQTNKAAVLQLKKGWNALHIKSEESLSITESIGTIITTTSVSVANPNLKWVSK
jgi:hypothetical protein